MAVYLILTDNGIVTKPVVANTDAELLAALQTQLHGGAVSVGAIQIDRTTTMNADGTVPAAFTTAQTNRADLLAKAANALAGNITFLAIASPTTAQVATQVKALTRQVDALARLIANQLDTTAGT